MSGQGVGGWGSGLGQTWFLNSSVFEGDPAHGRGLKEEQLDRWMEINSC